MTGHILVTASPRTCRRERSLSPNNKRSGAAATDCVAVNRTPNWTDLGTDVIIDMQRLFMV